MSTHLSVKQALGGSAAVGDVITVKGWVRTRRDSKAGISFLNVYDGSCFDGMQAVVPNSLDNYESEVIKLTAGCAVEVSGELVKSEGSGQAFEMQAQSVSVTGLVEDPETYPVAKKRHTFEFLRTIAHLRPRTNAFGAISRVRTTLANAVHNYFYEREFHWVNTPIITSSDCEGAGELFRVSTLDLANLPLGDKGKVDFEQDFFGSEAFLTVSGQLNVESFALALSKVYTFGPTFRAENSNTSRHLAEFWMIEPEIAFAGLDENAALAEDMLRYLFTRVLEDCADDMAFFAQRVDKGCIDRLEQMIKNDFVQMEYGEAIDILSASGKKFEYPVKWGLDLQSEHERFLTEEHVGKPIVLRNYPREIKAFYMRENDDDKTVAAMDVLAPGIGEIIGGSQREERLDVLDAKLEAQGIKDELWWYRDLRRYGTVPHAGFGLGFERLINYVTGMENIRDAIPFPRAPKSATF
ncbi:asparagine--tRNA ligase [Chromatiales bacterium (ex Bugula neritina AB1)]|nr:asparagine--tRNA ligase [Chromatiales bacterium (ex Bugula neritina AB1)]